MADPGIGGGGGGGGGGVAPARVWQGVGRSNRRGRPGEAGTPPAQPGSAVSSTTGVWGEEANAFCVETHRR